MSEFYIPRPFTQNTVLALCMCTVSTMSETSTPINNKRLASARTPGSSEPERKKCMEMAQDMEVSVDRVSLLEQKYACKSFEDMSRCFAILDIRLTDKVENHEKSIADIVDRVQDLEAHKDEVDKIVAGITEKDIPDVEKEVEELKVTVLKQDLWSRKWNLKFKGIEGDDKESAVETERKVKDFLKSKLNIDEAESIGFQAAHRLKGGPAGKKNIIARFVHLNDVDNVLKRLRHLTPQCGYSVQRDLPPSLDELRNGHLATRSRMTKDEKSRTKLVYLKDPPFVKLVSKK